MEIIVNFKNYKQGKDVLKLAKLIEKYIPKAIVAVPPSYLGYVSFRTELKVFSQHVDKNSKKSTGFVTVETIKNAGAKGSLLNHSEHKVEFKKIKEVVQSKVKLIVCAPNLSEVSKIKKLKPWAIAYEDPKFISTKKSITKYSPKEVKKFVKTLEKTKIIPICGAGIHSVEDIIEAKKLGCKGILISSAIANSNIKKSEKFLKEIGQLIK